MNAEMYMRPLAALSQNFGQAIPKELLIVWIDILASKGVTPEELGRAVRKVIAEYAFKTLPPLAVLLEAVKANRGASAKDEKTLLELKAAADWALLMDTVRSRGYGDGSLPETFSEACAATVRQLGGWHAVCLEWLEKDMAFHRKDFVELWKLNAASGLDLAVGSVGVQKALDRAMAAAPRGMLSLGEAFASMRKEREREETAEALFLDAPKPAAVPAPKEPCSVCGGSGTVRVWSLDSGQELVSSRGAWLCPRCGKFGCGAQRINQEAALAKVNPTFSDPRIKGKPEWDDLPLDAVPMVRDAVCGKNDYSFLKDKEGFARKKAEYVRQVKFREREYGSLGAPRMPTERPLTDAELEALMA